MPRFEFAWVLVAILFLPGCFEYSEVLEIGEDGSGKVTIHQDVDMDVYDQLRQLVLSMDPDAEKDLPDFSREWMEKALGAREGLRLAEYTVEDRTENGSRHRLVKIVIEFDNPESLVVATGALALRPFSFERKAGEDGSGESWVFARPVGIGPDQIKELVAKKKDHDPGDPEANEPGERKKDPWEFTEDSIEGFRMMAQSVTQGKKATFELVMPGEVEEANFEPGKGEIEGNRAVWRFDLADLLAQSKELRATARAGAAIPTEPPSSGGR